MDYGLRDRVVLVTGGSSGIGRSAAIAFGREGAKVAITYRSNVEGAKETVAALEGVGAEAVAMRLDLSDADSIWSAVGEVADRWGGIDVLVGNAADTMRHGAAFAPAAPGFADMSPEAWKAELVTGVDGAFHVVQAVLPAMRGRGWGRIAFVSSAAADRGGPREEAYAAGKAALAGLAASLAREFGREGILVNIVMPALTATERVQRFVPEPVREQIAGHLPTGRLSTPDDVAAAIVFLCSAANGNITSETLHVTGGG